MQNAKQNAAVQNPEPLPDNGRQDDRLAFTNAIVLGELWKTHPFCILPSAKPNACPRITMKYNPARRSRNSLRIKGFDYSKDATYFVTIATKDRFPHFGDIVQGEMVLSDAGHAAERCWMDIPKHYPKVVLHAFVIMPDHLHGMIELRSSSEHNDHQKGMVFSLPSAVQDSEPPMEGKKHAYQKIIPKSLGSIVRGHKIGVTKWFRANTEIHKPWQRNFHESIIKNPRQFRAVTWYILNNPKAYQRRLDASGTRLQASSGKGSGF